MEKITGLFIIIIGAGVFIYLLPFLSPFFGVDFVNLSETSDSASGQVIFLSNAIGENEPAFWHSSLKPDIFEIQNSPFDSSVLYAAASRGIFISRDSGKNWYDWSDLEKKIDGAAVYKIVFDKNAGGRAFVAALKNNRGYVYETKDNFFSLNLIFDSVNEAVYGLELVNGGLLIGLSDGRVLSYSLERKEFRLLVNFDSAIYNIKSANSHLYITTKSNGVFVRAGGLLVDQL